MGKAAKDVSRRKSREGLSDSRSGSAVPPLMRVYDFFSGCGGTSAGLRAAGIEVAVGLDCDREAGLTFRRNFPHAEFLERDIRDVTATEFDAFIDRRRTYPIMFTACAPCQPFSKQNRQKKTGDRRVSLLDELRRFIRRFKPEYLFVENVPGMQRDCDTGGPFAGFIEFLEKNGYSTRHDVVQSLRYGVPQYRQRLLLAATRMGPLELPSATHGPGTPNPDYPTVWQAIGDYPAIAAGEEHPDIPNHRACGLSPLNLARIRATPEGGSRKDWPTHLILDCHKGYDGHSDVYGRLRRDWPAAALTTRCISLSNGRFGHPVQDRALSIREAAAVQTFDDDFVFEGSLNSMAQQIGNAVPARLARTFGEHFLAHWQAATAVR
jgi:DNA (cytosine-5)-methyltransferase 1